MNIKTGTLAVLLSLFYSSFPAFGMDGLVGYWKMNEGEGVTIRDASGKSNDGEIIGNAKWEKDDRGNVLRFDGETSYVNIPQGLWNVEGEEITLLCLFQTDDLKGRVFDHWMGGAISGAYALDASGLVVGVGEIENEDWANLVQYQYRLSLPVGVGQWHLAVVTIKGSNVSGYLDGQIQGEAEVNRYFYVPGALTIGARGTSPDLFFSGLIREMAVVDRALTSEEIEAVQKRYDEGLPLFSEKADQ